jgi:hypothetical protein
MKRTIAVALLLMSMNASASDWKFISHSAGYTTLMQSITRTKSIVKAWVRQPFDTPQVNDAYPYEPYSVSKNQLAANCTNRTITVFQSYQYDLQGDTVASDSTTYPWNEPIPDSNGEAFLNTVGSKSQSF